MDHGDGTTAMAATKKHYTAMTFYWGKNSEILFTDWPGTRGGMYALALIFVFVLAVLVEWMRHARLYPTAAGRGAATGRRQAVAAGLAQTVVYAVRIGLAYLLMLAVMSFNGGLFIVVVFGHAVGFMAFGCPAFRGTAVACDSGKEEVMPCC